MAIGGGWDAGPTVSVGANTNTFLWNGPTCSTCGAQYLGAHSCSREDITRRIAELARLMDRCAPATRPVDRTAGCPCRKENGGSGICGCVMGGMQITCSAG